MIRSVRLRLTAACALIMGLVLVVMAGASFAISARQLTLQAGNSFLSDVNFIIAYLRGQQVISHDWLAATEQRDGLMVRVENTRYGILYNNYSAERTRLTEAAKAMAREDHGFDNLAMPSAGSQADILSFVLEDSTGSYRAAAARVPVGSSWLGVTVLKSRAPEQQEVLRLGLLFLICVVLAMVCLAGASWLFTGRALRPVEESRRRQTEFVAAASHEIRAPLTVIQMNTEHLVDAPAQLAGSLQEGILRECARLARLAEDLLSLAGADNKSWSVAMAPESPETMTLRVYEAFEQVAGARGVALRADLPSPPLGAVSCDSQRVEQLLAILVDNALRHVPEEGGEIRLSVARAGRWIRFRVEDNGPGVPEEDREKVFRRFYRGDASRTDKERHGLGLSIAREIAGLHKGTVMVEESGLGGAGFVFSLPAGKRG